MAEWQPISTAPKGDFPIIGTWLYMADGGPRWAIDVLHWERYQDRPEPEWTNGLFPVSPTHWFQPPEPPK